jgi:maleate cis-trans isomerase
MDFMRLVPDGVGVIPTRVGILEGELQEFRDAPAIAEEKVKELAGVGAEVIIVSGTPVSAVDGQAGEAKFTEEMEQKYGVPVITAGRAIVRAFHALGLHRIVVLTYHDDPEHHSNKIVRSFLEESGFEVAALAGYPVKFTEANKIHPLEIYALAKKTFLGAGGADGILLHGSGWRALPVLELLEQDLGTTATTNVVHEVWAGLQALRVREPIEGNGRLLREMPEMRA